MATSTATRMHSTSATVIATATAVPTSATTITRKASTRAPIAITTPPAPCKGVPSIFTSITPADMPEMVSTVAQSARRKKNSVKVRRRLPGMQKITRGRSPVLRAPASTV
ncbi:MAG: hypothetical protein JO142_05620 [Burkholderiales bacterium]|nr:hypothetical protein [Burkholderiales bacterium]